MLRLEGVSLSYGGQIVLQAQSLDVPSGKRIALMGPSGCGKTSLLHLAAGLVRPDSGTVERRGARVSCLFQEPRLLPWLTAEENVNAVLSDRVATRAEAHRWLEAVGLGADADKYPHTLSGGMQQRVSLARALAYGGAHFLLDEPLKGLDAETRADMLRLLRKHTAGKTVLLATHDEAEAEALADEIYIYRPHRFERRMKK